MPKTYKISLELTKSEIRRLSELMFKGTCYDDMYYGHKVINLDENLRGKVCDQLVNNSERYAGQNIKVITYNGEMLDEDRFYLWL